jgi:hypothetical protein
MTKEEIKTAIAAALAAHDTNRQAVQESAIPAGLEGIAAAAIANVLSARLAKICGPQSGGPTDYLVLSAASTAQLAPLVTQKLAAGYALVGGLQVGGQPASFHQAVSK